MAMSKYDYPGERVFGKRCGDCGGVIFRDIDDSIWCPKCHKVVEGKDETEA
jgi:rubredoxin